MSTKLNKIIYSRDYYHNIYIYSYVFVFSDKSLEYKWTWEDYIWIWRLALRKSQCLWGVKQINSKIDLFTILQKLFPLLKWMLHFKVKKLDGNSIKGAVVAFLKGFFTINNWQRLCNKLDGQNLTHKQSAGSSVIYV